MSDFNPLSNAQIPTHRSSFDLSSKKLFTAKVGEILPVYWQIAIPGNKYRISSDWFTRTVPVNTAAYTRIKEYYDFYAVPLRLISRALPQAFTQMSDYMTSAANGVENSTPLKHVPYTTLKNLSILLGTYQGQSTNDDDGGLPFCYGACKLLDYLGYGSFIKEDQAEADAIFKDYTGIASTETNPHPVIRSQFSFAISQTVNMLPLLAYQKIYYDFFSWNQWERHRAFAYNVDYWNDTSATPLNPDMFTLRYCNYPKDMFTGVLPKSQYGDVALLSTYNNSLHPNSVVMSVTSNPTENSQMSTIVNNAQSNDVLVSDQRGLARSAFLNANLSALSIRATEYLQRWKEVVQFASKDYTDQMKAQFGVSAPEYMGNHAHYIGGWSSVVSINEVVNNNLDADNSQASIAGKGVSSQSGHVLNYSCGAEHCVIMCVYHAVPLLDWSLSGQAPQLTVSAITDFPQPAFDQLGMQPVPYLNFENDHLLSTSNSDKISLGYNLRYWQWKSNIDTVHGAFRPGLAYQSWAAPISSYNLLSGTGVGSPAFTFRSFKVRPSQLNSIFQPQVSRNNCSIAYDQLLCNVNFQVYAVQNLDRNGLPY